MMLYFDIRKTRLFADNCFNHKQISSGQNGGGREGGKVSWSGEGENNEGKLALKFQIQNRAVSFKLSHILIAEIP